MELNTNTQVKNQGLTRKADTQNMFSKWKIFDNTNVFLDADQTSHKLGLQKRIGSLKFKPDLRAPMVECQSITPWMLL